MNVELVFILLFVVATAVAITARRLRLPYTVALVLAGLMLGALDLFPSPALTKDLLFSLILPALIFEAAFHIDSREFRENWITLVVLAFPGVLVSTALVTATLIAVVGVLHLAPGFGWRDALVFGALISATDPVAVVALFRTLGAPRRLTMLLDGESLLNDGTAIVVFTLSLSLLGGEEVRASPLLLQFVSIVGGGALIGMAVGALASLLIRQVDDPMVEITITTIAAYGSFAAAEGLHTSGVIAAVAAGMLCGNYGARTGMSASTRVATESFWEYVTFALNSVVFLLIGLEVHPAQLLTYWLPIVVGYLVVTAGRGIVMVLGRALVGWTRERFPWRWTAVLTWGGLRGALPMVLALSVPPGFRYRELIISMTFGVALLSILVHGLTMSAVLRRLGVVSAPADRLAYEIARGRAQGAAAALAELDQIGRAHLAPADVLTSLREEYRERMERADEEVKKLAVDASELRSGVLQRIRRRLLFAERDQVMQAYQYGTLERGTQERLLADIDARLLSLDIREETETARTSRSASRQS